MNPRFWGSNKTANPLSQKSVHLELNEDSFETTTRMEMVNNLTGNEVLLTTPEEGEDEGVYLGNNPPILEDALKWE